MSLAQGNNTPTRPRIEPGSPESESDALTTRPVRPPYIHLGTTSVSAVVQNIKRGLFSHDDPELDSITIRDRTKLFCLFGLRLYVPVNDFSVMSGRRYKVIIKIS